MRISGKECNNILSWMEAAKIISFCNKTDLRTGDVYAGERFYFNDLGLLNYVLRQYGFDKSVCEGVINENFIFKQLSENHFKERFFGDGPSFAVDDCYELDFLVKSKEDDRVYGIEVKSGKNTGISINKMLQNHKIDYSVYARKRAKVFEETEMITTIPVFLFNKYKFDKGPKITRIKLDKIDTFSM